MTVVSVEFKVRVNELLANREMVFVCGGVSELGDWLPMKARALRRQEHARLARSEVWSVRVSIPLRDIEYRYFIGTADDNHESSDERTINIRSWESNIKPRTRAILSEIANRTDINNIAMDIYGYIDDGFRVLKGWLTDQTVIQLRLSADSVKFYKTKNKSKRVFLKCYYHQMHKSHWNNDDYEDCVNGIHHQIAKFSKLTEESFVAEIPPAQGAEFCDEFMVFYVDTMDLEDTWIEIEVRQLAIDISVSQASTSVQIVNNAEMEHSHQVQDNENLDDYILIGTARLGVLHSEKSIKSISIINNHNRPIGELKIECLSISPLMGFRFSMEETYQMHWKHRKTLNVGHRGLGASYGFATKVSAVRENTLVSFRTALDHGADYVEFDVQLSKDKVPVLYHDFQVCTVLRKKRKNDLQYLEIPVKDLTLSDLQSLKVDPTCVMVDEQREERMNMEDIDPHELQPFPTLQVCLQEIQENLGFNIELKYPQTLDSGESEQPNYFDRNVYVDVILKVIFKYAGKRRIIFSSFDADVCLMTSMKQNKYPVLFLTQGETTHYEMYQDVRARSLQCALYFAKSANILGLSVYSDTISNNVDTAKKILEKKLILFIWGEEIDNVEKMNRWREIGVHGLIFDRIHELNQNGSANVFCLPVSDSSNGTHSQRQPNLIVNGNDRLDTLAAADGSMINI